MLFLDGSAGVLMGVVDHIVESFPFTQHCTNIR